MGTTGTTDAIFLKLLIDRKGHKVLYAEAGKKFVDFLFALMSLPIGTVTSFLGKDSMVGSLGKIYESIETISDIYMLPNIKKDTLLKPNAGTGSAVAPFLSTNGEGYVKDVVTYMIMDNLEVKPMSTISCITMLNKFNVKEVGALEEMEVQIGIDEGLKLLKASLESDSVLTSVFLGKKDA